MTEELENKKLERRAKEWLVKDKGGSIIQSLVNLIKEFTELREKRISELEKENAELNGKLLEQKQYTEFKCNEAVKKKEIYEREHFLLTKAKEIIKRFSEFVNNGIEYDPEHPQEHTDLWNELCENAEQFLQDSKVEK